MGKKTQAAKLKALRSEVGALTEEVDFISLADPGLADGPTHPSTWEFRMHAGARAVFCGLARLAATTPGAPRSGTPEEEEQILRAVLRTNGISLVADALLKKMSECLLQGSTNEIGALVALAMVERLLCERMSERDISLAQALVDNMPLDDMAKSFVAHANRFVARMGVQRSETPQ